MAEQKGTGGTGGAGGKGTAGGAGGTGGGGQKTLEMRVAELEDRLAKVSGGEGQGGSAVMCAYCQACFTCNAAALPCIGPCIVCTTPGATTEASGAASAQAAPPCVAAQAAPPCVAAQGIQSCIAQGCISPIGPCIIYRCIIRCIVRCIITDCINECGGGCLPGGGTGGGGFGGFGM